MLFVKCDRKDFDVNLYKREISLIDWTELLNSKRRGCHK